MYKENVVQFQQNKQARQEMFHYQPNKSEKYPINSHWYRISGERERERERERARERERES